MVGGHLDSWRRHGRDRQRRGHGGCDGSHAHLERAASQAPANHPHRPVTGEEQDYLVRWLREAAFRLRALSTAPEEWRNRVDA